MINKIEQDHQRFRQIVRGKIRGDLRRFISRGDFIGKEGGRFVSVPIHDIDIPTFRYGDNSGGVGMGDGQEGERVPGGKGGEEEGRHVLEVDVSLEELADMLGEELQLPRIEPKGEHKITTVKDKYSLIRPTGPASLRHFKRSYKEAIKRQLALGTYNPDDPVVVPIRRDMRYRSWNEVRKPQSNALIVYMMDVSGSMGDEQKELVRLEAFWIDTWLRRNYEGIESRYIVHDVQAQEVDRPTFYSVREDGGTRISSAYQKCLDILQASYAPQEWNIYLFHFSDGDNSSEADNRLCVSLLEKHLVPMVNMFGYCQVASPYGSGTFINVLREAFGDPRGIGAGGGGAGGSGSAGAGKVITSRVNGREDILESLRTLFKAGK